MKVAIDRLCFGGSGFGRVDGKACFVPFTAPGDVAEVTVTAEKKSYLTGRADRIVSPSPARTSPPCPVFGKCGGCQWQHLPYESQITAKEEIFAETLWRTARVLQERILPALAAPEPFGYRSRVQLKVHARGERPQIGFYGPGSHYVVDIADCCPLAALPVNDVLPQLRAFLSRSPERGNIPQIDIATGEAERGVVIFHYIGADRDAFSSSVAGIDLPPHWDLAVQSGRKSSLALIRGGGRLSYGSGTQPPLSLSFGAGGFSQVNYRQNRALIAEALRMADLTGTERVVDLYCGNGNFSLPLAGRAASVTGLEAYGPSIDEARSNAAANGIENAFFLAEDAAAGVKRLAADGERFDVALLDPPRTGAADCVRHLHRLGVRKIVYVSCDPPTLGRDLAILAAAGFTVTESRPVDMFPQTYHIESVTLLKPTTT